MNKNKPKSPTKTTKSARTTKSVRTARTTRATKMTKKTKKNKTSHKLKRFSLKRFSRSPVLIMVLLALAGGLFWATKAVSAARADDSPEFHRGIVSISFVNGYKEQYTIAKNLLKPRKIGASFYVPTENIGKKGYVTLANLVELKNLGFEVGNMTSDNTSLLGLNKTQIVKRYAQAQTWLKDNGLGSPKTCLYPGGPFGNNNTLPSTILDAVTSKSLGFRGCIIRHESVMFKESYNTWKLQNVFVDQRIDSEVLIHAIRNMAGGHTWGNLRIAQIDVSHDNTDSLTTTQILTPVFDEMVRLRTDKWINTPNVSGSLNLAKR
jgi:peptidoglycan/xylan/chitin deacetylase (PgdA/CDA1 family)